MRENFEKNLYELNEEAKEAATAKSKEERLEFKEELEEVINKTAKAEGVGAETVGEIYKLQQDKNKVMRRLKQGLRLIDSPEGELKPKEGDVLVRYESGQFLAKTADGLEVPVLIGEILTDGEWEINYYLDPESVPREVRKRYLVESAKAKLRDKLDEQIMANELAKEDVHEGKKEAYQAIKERKEFKTEQGGVIAEKMVRNFLKKVMTSSHVNLEILDSDVYQDVEEKIDFIVRKKPLTEDEEHLRGVKVEETSNKIIGIQFTTNTSPEKFVQKTKQIELAKKKASEVEDIVLVTIPLENSSALYRKWKESKLPGGPDKLWSEEIKEEIIKKVLGGMFNESEIAECIQSIRK